ncbi:response regulator [Terrimonas sp. NA20]|uniref:Response regulator n=1 Tax=Terrimonas ginsenosidimutans TaxID=2908004 RepID=A0ABS9KV91_9BACT|nr:response regulator [Terrimonas ginsenosidimutans]MCG2616264.1 response regulator [Terrimonas ginsenosidimutans]
MTRILLVDDDVDLLISLKTFLKKQGYEITTTTTCSSGLNILRSVEPNLVILDINVGEEDGRSMCRQIKREAELQHIPVILISANHQELGFYKNYGANASLPKPFRLNDLSELIQKTLSGDNTIQQ